MIEKYFQTFKAWIYRHHVLLLLLCFALALRLIYFFGILEGDDFDYVFWADYLVKHGFGSLADLDNLIVGSNRPGLYLPVALLFKVFGTNEPSAILFPLAASLVTCFLLYKIASRLAGKEAGLYTAFLWAVFPLDIFLATQLDPEGPLTMCTVAAVYFALLGGDKRNKYRLFLYALSALFVWWAFLIKQSSLPVVFVLLLLALKTYWPVLSTWWLELGRKVKIAILASFIVAFFAFLGFVMTIQPWPLVINNTELSSYDMGPAWFQGRMNPVNTRDLGGYYFQVGRQPVLPLPARDLLSHYPRSLHFWAFDAYSPLLLAGIAIAVVYRKKVLSIPLLWFGVLYFYLEWGIYPRSFTSSILFSYLPISHWISSDNFLYISVPMVVIVSLLIADNVQKSWLVRVLVGAMLLVLGAALFQMVLPDWSAIYLGLGVLVVSLTAFLAIPFLLNSNKLIRSLFYSGMIAIIGVASMRATPHYHVDAHAEEQQLRTNLQSVNEYLADQPASLIYTGQGPVARMDFYAGSIYGYSRFNQAYFPETRLTNDLDVLKQKGGFEIHEGCGLPVATMKDWPVREFGDPASPMCISLIHWIPENEIGDVLEAASNHAYQEPTLENLSEFLHAASQANEFAAFVEAMSLMVNEDIGVPIFKASELIVANQSQGSERVDLLSRYVQGLDNWTLSKFLTPVVLEEDGKIIVAIKIDKKIEEPQTISLDVELRPSTAYILRFEVISFAPFDLVRIPGIPDSFADSWRRADDWTVYNVVFVTPNSNVDSITVTLELARVVDRGEIQFRSIELTEVLAE